MEGNIKKTVIINLFASPGSGKSTMAAGIFCGLKIKGIDCEIASEFAKDLVWEERFKALSNQLYVSGKQSHRISRLEGKVDVIITDSPILLSAYYNRINKTFNPELFDKLMLEDFNKHDNINYFINLKKHNYNTNGRLQTSDESEFISLELKKILDDFNIKYIEIEKSEESIKTIVDYISTIVEKHNNKGEI